MPSPIMRWFRYDYLKPGKGKEISALFAQMAHHVENELRDGPEKSVALRKILEGKDAAVRQAILDEESTPQSG